MKQKIIVIGQGYTGRLSIIRSLGGLDCEITVIALVPFKANGKDLNKRRTIDSYSKYVHETFFCLNNDEEGLIRILFDKCAVDGKKAVIFPDNDFSAAVVDKYGKDLEHYYLIPHVRGEYGGVLKWMDKIRQKELASRVGLKVASSTIIKVRGQDCLIPQTIQYPCFAKPLVSIVGGKHGLRKCNNEEELKGHLAFLNARKGNVDVLVEDYKIIQKEYACVGFSDGEKVLIPGVIEIVKLAHGSHFGVALEGKIMPTAGFEDVLGQFTEMIRLIGFVGIFDVDFYQSDNVLFFGEINLRFGGSGYAYTKCGVNLPRMMVDYFIGKDVGWNESISKESVFFNERMAFDEWVNRFISREEYESLRAKANILFVEDPSDPGPQKALNRTIQIRRIVNMIKRWMGRL